LVRFLEREFGPESGYLVVAAHQPAAEGFVVTGLSIDDDPDVRVFVVTLLGGGGQGQLDGFENNVAVDTFFVGDCISDQQYFFIHASTSLLAPPLFAGQI